MVERSGQPEILISCSEEWVAGNVPQKAWFGGGICILGGGVDRRRAHTQSRTSGIQPGWQKRDLISSHAASSLNQGKGW